MTLELKESSLYNWHGESEFPYENRAERGCPSTYRGIIHTGGGIGLSEESYSSPQVCPNADTAGKDLALVVRQRKAWRINWALAF